MFIYEQACFINTSLMQFKKLIRELGEGKNGSYNETKLTKVMKDSLGKFLKKVL